MVISVLAEAYADGRLTKEEYDERSGFATTALTLGAGLVLGGSDSGGRSGSSGGAVWVEAHDGDGPHGVRVFRWGGPRLGVSIDDVTPEKASEAGLDRPYGVIVKEVEKDSPASRAGIEAGDLIVGYDGERVTGSHALMRMVRETPEGRVVTVDDVLPIVERHLTTTLR